jgi:hypothetical protein
MTGGIIIYLQTMNPFCSKDCRPSGRNLGLQPCFSDAVSLLAQKLGRADGLPTEISLVVSQQG